MLVAGDGDGVDDGVGRATAGRIFSSSKFKNCTSKGALCAISVAPSKKASISSAISAKQRLVAQELVAEPVHARRPRPAICALGVDVFVEVPAGRDVVDQLDAADLDHAVPGQRTEAGGFGVDDDLAGHSMIPSGWAWFCSASTMALTAARGLGHASSFGIDHIIGALALFILRHLPGKDGLELFHGHARPGQARVRYVSRRQRW